MLKSGEFELVGAGGALGIFAILGTGFALISFLVCLFFISNRGHLFGRSTSKRKFKPITLLHCMFAILLTSFFLGLRATAIHQKSEMIAVLSPSFFAMLLALTFSFFGMTFGRAMRICGATAFFLAAIYAFECVYHFPTTRFMKKNWPSSMYYDDPEVAVSKLLLATSVGLIGSAVLFAVFKYLRPHDTQNSA